MENKVKKVINEWDPINLLHHAPDDEYEGEISEIIDSMSNISNEEELAEVICKTFTRCFGSDIFRRSKNECITIARRILY